MFRVICMIYLVAGLMACDSDGATTSGKRTAEPLGDVEVPEEDDQPALGTYLEGARNVALRVRYPVGGFGVENPSNPGAPDYDVFEVVLDAFELGKLEATLGADTSSHASEGSGCIPAYALLVKKGDREIEFDIRCDDDGRLAYLHHEDRRFSISDPVAFTRRSQHLAVERASALDLQFVPAARLTFGELVGDADRILRVVAIPTRTSNTMIGKPSLSRTQQLELSRDDQAAFLEAVGRDQKPKTGRLKIDPHNYIRIVSDEMKFEFASPAGKDPVRVLDGRLGSYEVTRPDELRDILQKYR